MPRRSPTGGSRTRQRSRRSQRRAKTKVKADPAEVLGRNVHRACNARGIDSITLAKLIGRPVKTAERIMSGKMLPNLKLIVRIADSIRTPLTDLLRGL